MRKNVCTYCICRKCSGRKCYYEKYYKSLPFNPACAHCTMTDQDHPITSCDDYTARTMGKVFRIKSRRVNPYYRIAVLLVALHKAINDVK